MSISRYLSGDSVYSSTFDKFAPAGMLGINELKITKVSNIVIPGENAFEVVFLAKFLLWYSIIYGAWGILQILQLHRKKRYGSYLSVKSEGFKHNVKLALQVVQGLSILVLAVESFDVNGLVSFAYFVNFLLTSCVMLPLQIIEVHKSIWQVASSLFYVLTTPMVYLAFVYQDRFTDFPVIGTGLFISVQYFSFLLACAIFIFEVLFWERCHELTYHLKLNDVDVNSIYNTNVFGRISYTNLNSLINKAYEGKAINFEDLPGTPDDLKSEKCYKELNAFWNEEVNKEEPWLFTSLAKAYGPSVAICTIVQIMQILFNFVQPQLLKIFMTLFLNVDKTQKPEYLKGILICLAMTFTSFCVIVTWNEYVTRIFSISFKVRLGMTSLVYDKSMKLSTKARSTRNVGDIVNMISVDIGKVESTVTMIQTIVSSPLQFFLCIFSLYFLLGWSSFTGLIVIAIAMPINSYAIKRIEVLYDQSMKFKDMRTKAINELIGSIKSIKLYSLEKPMTKKISQIRNEMELVGMKKIGVLDCIINFSWSCVPFFVSCITFGSFTYFSNQKLTSDLIFPSLSLFELLGDPLVQIPDLISGLIETKVSVQRLTKFLLDEELDESFIEQYDSPATKGKSAAEIHNATFLRSDNKEELGAAAATENSENANTDAKGNTIALKNIDFVAKKGELTCIVGNVGSGKTTFLHSLLGHFPMVPGKKNGSSPRLKLSGNIAYCPQNPWIMNASIKKNILFGHKYDPEFYEKTVDACALRSDFKILPDGDETQVGEKGIALSGGQKARVSLARAIYRRADIYLLDDVLSAVDAHVSKHIVDKVLGKDGILTSKTLILSTNNIHVLEEAHMIYVLDHGNIDEKGSYQSLLDSRGEFYHLIQEFGKSSGDYESSEETVGEESESSPVEKSVADQEDSDEVIEFEGSMVQDDEDNALDRINSRQTLRRASIASFHVQTPGSDSEKKEGAVSGQTKESLKKGRVTWSTYVRYAQAAGYSAVCLSGLAVLMVGVTEFGSKLWLKHWADVNDSYDDRTSPVFLIVIYCLFGILSGVSVLFSGLCLWYFGAINASRNIHAGLVDSIMKSPMSFFERTPTGRILNRFSEDISKLDMRFPHGASQLAECIVRASYTLGLIAFTLPSTILFIVILSGAYSYVQMFYVSTSRETKRIASVARSPVYSHVHETLLGVDTIRAHDQTERFKKLNFSNLDYSINASMSQIWMTRWLNFRLKSISTVFLFIVTLSCVYSLRSTPLSAGVVGLLTSFSFQITDTLNWLVRMSVDVETNAVAIERIFEYSDLPSEKPFEIEETRPPIQWPMKGDIKFVNYTTKYNAAADPVLKNISFEVKPQEKVGIVGRTGAGKSSLTLALFRIIEATDGKILIDDIDTSVIGLYDLRSKLNIIPQDSQAFEGTVRHNLDPFHKYKDEALWKVLEMAHLKDHIESMKDPVSNKDDKDEDNDIDKALKFDEIPEGAEFGKGLYAKVNDGGSNLSAGQKQLLCLARALLNSSKILIMDEATAAVDVKTDKIVQETIRTEFKDKTILTIAHRIDTIMDNDKILVLDKGEVKEFDSPENLLNDKSTIFYSLCEKGGYLKNRE